MRAIITGGAGFIGSNLARTLQIDRDARLIVIDDFRTGATENLSDQSSSGWRFGGEVVDRSLGELDVGELVSQFDPDVIFHEASITDTTMTDEAEMMRDNVEPFKALLDVAIRGNVKLVWASSAATYGTSANGAVSQRRPFRLEDAGRPANAYGESKWLMENLHRQALSEHPGAHLVGLRYFNVFGPGEQSKKKMASMVYQLAQQMLHGQRPRIFHDGEQARDQVYVRDVVDATVAAAGAQAASGIYNVGSGQTTTFNQIIVALNAALDTDYPPQYFDNPYPFYQNYTCADMTQTQSGLGWSPHHAPEQAIGEYAQWLRSRREK